MAQAIGVKLQIRVGKARMQENLREEGIVAEKGREEESREKGEEKRKIMKIK